MTETDWDHIVDMNLKSVFLCCQAVLPAMLKQKSGKIISISSIYGFTGNATRSSYAAAKAGVQCLPNPSLSRSPRKVSM